MANEIDAILQEMQGLIAAYSDARSVQQDFQKFDVATITANLIPGARFIWVIYPGGTHLTQVGFHKGATDWARASIKNAKSFSSQAPKFYLIENRSGFCRVKELNELEALLNAGLLTFDVKGEQVYRDDRVWAYLQLEKVQKGGNLYANVQFSGPSTSLGQLEQKALLQIAEYETVNAWASFFARPQAVRFNEVDLLAA